MNNFDTSKYHLGQMCKYGHDWHSTGKSLRNKRRVCLECDRVYRRARYQLKPKKHSPTLEERLWSQVEKSSDGCWIWTGSKVYCGYGVLKFNGRQYRVHRVVWELTYGAIPKNMFICHQCDVPSCVNPKHLFLGTNVENISDRHTKGRSASGAKNGNSKLSANQVREIRQIYERKEATQVELSAIYGVAQSQIGFIVNYQNWKHI